MAVTEQFETRGSDYTVDNEDSSQRAFLCPWADRLTETATLKGSVHPDDANLKCSRVNFVKYGTSQAWLTADYEPAAVVEEKEEADSPALGLTQISHNIQAEALTIGTGKSDWRWSPYGADDGIDNKVALPTKQVIRGEIKTSGTLTSFSMATVASYIGKLNDETFLGCSSGTLLLVGCNSTMRKNSAGTTLYDVSYTFKYNADGWNNFYKESSSSFVTIRNGAYGAGAEVYDDADMTAL
jgi:hypothetical protein